MVKCLACSDLRGTEACNQQTLKGGQKGLANKANQGSPFSVRNGEPTFSNIYFAAKFMFMFN